MTPGRRSGRILAVMLALGVGLLTHGAEPWADPRLAITNGIALWYDASRQTAARGAVGLSPLRSWNDAVDLLLDGSGHQRDAVQPLAAARPGFAVNWGVASLEFDGKDDFLSGVRGLPPGTNATVFLVVSIREFGGFRGLLAWSARGRNDYTSGFNLDVGSLSATNLARLNVEGAGFAGERNLLDRPRPAGDWQVLEVTVGSDPPEARLRVGGEVSGSRPRAAVVSMLGEEITLGARRYSNTSDRPHVQGFFGGALAEVLVFDRALATDEQTAVREYLHRKYSAVLGPGRHRPDGELEGVVPLVTVSNPPPVQVHFPGFEVRELPLELPNVNNVRCRPDGRILAVGYDGRIWLLRDIDGDGLEDRAEPFWDRQTFRAPIGAALTPPGYDRGEGVFVAAKDRVVLVVDRDGDGRGDEETTVATWTERSEQQGVDALGVAVGADGSVYFSLGAASFTEPFLVDPATGKARYRTSMERGTLLRVSPDLSRREVVCTGIRFAVGLAFNAAGDLFATDQEGATWRPDGNPFDELLHIQSGRHYGFPPRHPRHLPEVVDEPSVFDYAPQHQSTCGLLFNEPVAGGAAFGPASWRGEAMVAGYSRGKLWRTRLVKSPAGYVAQTRLLATLQALTVDACVTGRGDLVIAAHGGQPDWGSGPTGRGRLWRVRWKDREASQPVAVWNAGPTELRVGFDRALRLEAVKDLQRRIRIEGGVHVFPGDRFETIRPGYQVVYDQLAAERRRYEVLGVGLSPDLRTLSIQTRGRVAAMNYAVTLPAGLMGSAGAERSAADEVDLLSDLTGVEARWESLDGKESWAGWLPHADLDVAKAFTLGSAEAERLFGMLERPGRLVIRGQLDLHQMLQPAIQPGSVIDWERPPERVTVRLEGVGRLAGRVGSDSRHRTAERAAGGERLDLVVEGPGRDWQPFEVEMTTGPGARLTLSWFTAADDRLRPFPLRRFLLPWAQPSDAAGAPASPREPSELAGGHWLRGRRLFFGDQLGCAKCHVKRVDGRVLGPDLSNLRHRDVASVWKDIEQPSAAINPDHLASIVELATGESVLGIVVHESSAELELAVAGGETRRIPRERIRSIAPSTVSLMPEGLVAHLTEGERRDLLAYLMTEPVPVLVHAESLQGHRRPLHRSIAEVERILQGSRSGKGPDAVEGPFRLVLCAAAKDGGHGAPGFHDYPLWRERWGKLFALADGVVVEQADRWPSPEQWAQADLIAFYHDNPAWEANRAADLDAFLDRGGGLVFLHWSINAYRDVEPLAGRLGCAWGPGARFRHGPEELTFHPHELTAGFPKRAQWVDEAYWNLPGNPGALTVVASSVEEGAARPQVWTREQGKGRVFVCIPGHFSWTFDDPLYRLLVFRGMAWAARQPLGRFDELIRVGAAFSP